MGMYTEFHFNCELKSDVPNEVIEVLQYMLRDNNDAMCPPLPSHPLFKTARWDWMLRSDSYYFPADTHSTLRWDENECWYLCIRCNLKNYSGEIEHFVDWIMPYIDEVDGELLGFSRYENNQKPELIYYRHLEDK